MLFNHEYITQSILFIYVYATMQNIAFVTFSGNAIIFCLIYTGKILVKHA